MKRIVPVLLLSLGACDLDAFLKAAAGAQGGPYGEGPLEVQTASLRGRLAGDTFDAGQVAPTGSWTEDGAQVELHAPGRAGYGMVFLSVVGGGLDHEALAPGNEYTLTDYSEVRPGGPVVSLVGCWATQEGEPFSYDAHAEKFQLAVEPGDRPDEVLFRVSGGLPYENRSEPVELTFLARRALTEEQLAAQQPEPAREP